jgi:hypothetical protein
MDRNDPTKRQHGDISARFGLSACILIPPLLLAAGLALFDSFAPQAGDLRPAKEQAQFPQTVVAKSGALAGRSDAGSSLGLANAETRPVATERRAVSAQRPEQPASSAQSAGPAEAATESVQHFGPVPVTILRVRKVSEQPEVADLETTAGIVAPPNMSRRLPVPTRSFAACHSRGRVGRHKPHAHPVKHQRSAALTHKAPRPSIRKHAQHR